MQTITALEAVIELARQGMIDAEDMPHEHARQKEAINIVEDLAVNEYGED